MNQVLFKVITHTEKADLKLDSLSFLTLVTKLESHSAFCKIPQPYMRYPGFKWRS